MDVTIIFAVVAVLLVYALARSRSELKRGRKDDPELPIDAAWIAELAARDDAAADAEADTAAGTDADPGAEASMPGDEGYVEMEEAFFRRASEGEHEVKLLRAYFPQDIMLLRSLLQSEQVPFRTEFDAMSGIMPGVQIANFNETYFYVLAADRAAALDVVASYLDSKLVDQGKPPAAAAARGFAELVLAGWRAPDNSLRHSIDVFE